MNVLLTSALLAVVVLSGCATGDASKTRTDALALKEKQLDSREQALADQRNALQEQAARLNAREAELKQAAREAATPLPAGQAAGPGDTSEPLLPPDAKPGECYARVYNPPKYKVIAQQVLRKGETSDLQLIPAQFETVTERVLVRPETTRIEVVPATYKTVSERVLVKAATTKLVQVAARYEEQSEKILVKAGYKTWKKGTGPIQRIDEATGEIMCLVDVPPVYKTITKRIQLSAPGVREVAVPAVYRNVSKQVVATPARTREIVVPAEYKTVSVEKLVAPAREVRTPIPAVYETIERRELMTPGGLRWRSILCDTNMTKARLKSIQRALAAAGFDPGPIDGIVQQRTMAAVNNYQRANGLPVDQYLNIETVRSLGVLPR